MEILRFHSEAPLLSYISIWDTILDNRVRTLARVVLTKDSNPFGSV